MDLRSLFETLSYGELSNTSIGNDGAGTIRDQDHARIISFVNQGLQRLFTRFRLKESELVLRMHEQVTVYTLTAEHADCSAPEGADPWDVYIEDDPEAPFEDDVVKLLSVADELGCEYTLNAPGHPFSFYTPQFNQLQILNPVGGETISVIYQAAHPRLLAGDLTQTLDIPDFLEAALTAFVGHKVFNGMSGPEHVQRSAELLAQYEAICAEVEIQDLYAQSIAPTSNRFSNNGWV